MSSGTAGLGRRVSNERWRHRRLHGWRRRKGEKRRLIDFGHYWRRRGEMSAGERDNRLIKNNMTGDD